MNSHTQEESLISERHLSLSLSPSAFSSDIKLFFIKHERIIKLDFLSHSNISWLNNLKQSVNYSKHLLRCMLTSFHFLS